jgi:hypothetical protein
MASLIKLQPVTRSVRIANGVLVAVKLIVLVYFAMYAIRYFRNDRLKMYHDLLLPMLVVVALTSSPVVTVAVLVAWAVRRSCNKDIGALLVAIVVLLTLEIMYQIGVVVSGKLAVGVVGPPSLSLGMGVIGRRRGAAGNSRVSLSA